jgi:phage anti-repressor protein
MNAIKTILPIASRIIAGCTAETVHARKLHKFLEVGRDYSNWIKARIGSYGFTENEDYVLVRQNGRTKNHGGDRRSIEHYITLDMAKELAMVERNEKGREARRYFIKCEARLKQELKAKLKGNINMQDSFDEMDSLSREKVSRVLMAFQNGEMIHSQVISPTSIVIEAENLADFIQNDEFFPASILPEILSACSTRIVALASPPSKQAQPSFI